MDSDEDDAYLSESGEAQMILKKRGPQSQPAAGGQRQPKKKKKTRSTQAFRDSVKAEHGVDLEDVPNLKNNKAKRNSCRCKSCGSVKENKAVYWKGHRTKCEGAKRISEKRQLRLYTGAGGEQHRQNWSTHTCSPILRIKSGCLLRCRRGCNGFYPICTVWTRPGLRLCHLATIQLRDMGSGLRVILRAQPRSNSTTHLRK